LINKKYNLIFDNVYHIKDIFELVKIIRKASRDELIIHSSGLIPDFVLSLLILFIPKKFKSFSTIRNIPWEDYKFKWKIFGPLISKLHILFLRQINVICCSKTVYSAFQKRKYIFQSLNFIDNCYTLKNIDQSNQIKAGKFKILSVSPIINRKRVLESVKLFKKLKMDFEFDIYGEGDQKSDLVQIINNDKRFRYMGFIKNDQINFSHYDSLISFSASEGLPNSVIESLYCGSYAILSSISSHKYLAKFSRKVLIIDYLSEEKILKAISYILRNRDSKKDIESFRDYFSKSRMLNQYHYRYNLKD
tara:strand:- start:3048 stop:3962 length:915 start_codon:yes stop_codon:yes gene_type:complete